MANSKLTKISSIKSKKYEKYNKTSYFHYKRCYVKSYIKFLQWHLFPEIQFTIYNQDPQVQAAKLSRKQTLPSGTG